MEVQSYAPVGDREGTVRKIRALLAIQISWMTVLTLVLFVLDVFTLENLYILSYLGLVITAQLLAPPNRTPRWWWTVQWTIRLGFLGFCYFIALRVIDVLNL